VLRNELACARTAIRRSSTDPADGRIPPMTPEGLKRAAPTRDGGNVRSGPSTAETSVVRRCITRGIIDHCCPCCTATGSASADAAVRGDQLRDDSPNSRIIPLDGRPHQRTEPPTNTWATRAPLGRQHAGCRDDEFHRRGPASAPTATASRHSARCGSPNAHPHRSRDDRLRGDDRRVRSATRAPGRSG